MTTSVSTLCRPPAASPESRLHLHFLTCAAATAACGTAPAQAVVVYSGIVNLNAPATFDGLYLNVITGEWWITQNFERTDWDLCLFTMTGSTLNFYHPDPLGAMRYPGITTGNAGNLTPGTEVGSAGSFSISTGPVVFGANAGNWQLNADNYFGFRFVNEAGSTTHYGWGRLAVGASSAVRTLVDYAYESEAGQPINVGAGMVPEPRHTQLLSALALGAVGLLYRRNRRHGRPQPA
ncbi:MAG: hypothetical protein HS113_12670 [Verrucomicrobiales bacterium]|nr:hypothetical protein [Verrucomicrobiales bacterium]